MTLFQNPTIRFYAPKLGFVLFFPLVVCLLAGLPLFKPQSLHESFPLRLCLAALLALGAWNLNLLPTVKGQPWQYRLAMGLFQGFFIGVFALLLSAPKPADAMLMQFTIMAVMYGGVQAVWYPGKDDASAIDLKTLPKNIIMLVLAYAALVTGLLSHADPIQAMVAPVAVFAACGFPKRLSWKTNEGKLHQVLTFLILGIALAFILT